jgi:sulfur carrier protein
VNGTEQTFTEEVSVTDLLARLGYKGECAAVAINSDLVPRAERTSTRVRDGDEIEILTPMQGG